ncbi:putative CCAAT-binding transcription factor [Plasmodium gaboni]|uniref:CCAAT-binding transcription factor, putative n=1 Tax=Plasmodium gaboni TaxID=647221 RepID=A0A151LD40_9APIC|nr:putative CCAAT-binding transcription factor [Plasmodium gaboni]KYN96883.1 putative CCAAT-binding transcription factor [Plasmodium gaboni]SOV17233.1 CCAAT-binding transcription factor, putative [Plasmodium gaboni]SOV24134.1 CCAAT-binding transcription factor, putative [Plasmodium sp. DRC-Itaito]
MENKNNEEQTNKIKETLFGLSTGIIQKAINNNVDLKNYRMRREALETLGKCLSMFILYITDGAMEYCENEKRSTILVRDILNSLDDSLFLDIHDELKRQLTIQEETNRTEISKVSENIQAQYAENNELDNNQKEGKPKNKDDDFDILLQALE